MRCFENDDIAHVTTTIDPVHDIEIINTELLLADLETVERGLEKAERQAKTAKKKDIVWRDLLIRLRDHLDTGLPARKFAASADHDQVALRELHLLTAKPVMYIANVDELCVTADGSANQYVAAVRNIAEAEAAELVVICAALETELVQLDEEHKQAFLLDLGLEEPGLDRVIRAGYRLLGLQTFFTAAPKEIRAWTAKAGATALEAAGEIHTDFQRGWSRLRRRTGHPVSPMVWSGCRSNRHR